MKEEQLMTTAHLELFSRLASSGRVSIRDTNEQMPLWRQLRSARLCTIFETDRAGTVVIHLTPTGEHLSIEFVSSLQNELSPACANTD